MLREHGDSCVLFVDGGGRSAGHLRELIVAAGLRRVYAFADPAQALARLDQIRPDLVVVDMSMAELDRYGVLGRVACHAAGAYLPVLVLTSDDQVDAVQCALGQGARDLLIKPYERTEALLRVRNLLDTRALYATLRLHNRWLRAQVGISDRGDPGLDRARIADVIHRHDVQLVVQPVVDLQTRRVVGAEALARFHDELEPDPQVWFSAAVRTGLGVALEMEAIRAAAPLLDQLPQSSFLAVNVSPATLLSHEFDLRSSPLLGPRLVLELTEHTPVEDYNALNASIQAMRDLGVRLAVDDTGAGYSSLRHLLALQPDIVKLDISLTRGVDRDPARRALAAALVGFTQEVGIHLIAEGVETAAEAATLQALGVPWAQGYYFGRPGSVSALRTLEHRPPNLRSGRCDARAEGRKR